MATTLGIDIGRRSIRGALLKTGMRTVEVERYLEVPITSSDPEEPRDTMVLSALKDLSAQLGTTPDNVILAIDGSKASLRTVTIPMAARKRALEVLPFELDPLLPFPVDDSLVDYQEVKVQANDVSLLAAAVPEMVVADTLEYLAQTDLNPRELAVGAAALDGLTPFLKPPPDEAWLLLHLDLESSELCILNGGACELARTVDEGTEALQARPMAFRNAIAQTMMKYRADGGPIIRRVVVMGQHSEDPGLSEWLRQNLQLPCGPLTVPADKSGAASPTFGRALALAGRVTRRGRRIDMRKGKYALPRGVSQLRDYALLAVGCALAIVLSYSFRVWAEYRVLSQERDALEEKLAAVTEQHFGEATRSPKRARELFEGGATAKDPLPRFDALRALGAISAAVPADVKHDTRKLEIVLDEAGNPGTFELQGQIPDLTARDQVAEALDAHECIEGLERGKTSTVPGQERKNYTLSGTIACPGATAKGKGKGEKSRGGR